LFETCIDLLGGHCREVLFKFIDMRITSTDPTKGSALLQEQRGKTRNAHRTGRREVCCGLFHGAPLLVDLEELVRGDGMTKSLKSARSDFCQHIAIRRVERIDVEGVLECTEHLQNIRLRPKDSRGDDRAAYGLGVVDEARSDAV
jgi:hypothetical protein